MLIYGTNNYPIRSFYFFEAIVFASDLYLRNSCLFQSCVDSASQIKLANKDLQQTWGSTSPNILRCYVVKALYISEVIRTKLKNNQSKKKRYDSGLFVDRLIMTTMVLNQGGSTRWFNPAAAIQVDFKKPIGFILFAMCKLFSFEIHIKFTRPIFLMAIPSLTKLLLRWCTLNLQPTINRGKYQYRCIGTSHILWTERQSHLRMYKEFVIPVFGFKAKKADEWAVELWLDKLYKKRSVWLFWLSIVYFFWPDRCIANFFYQTCKVPSMNLAIISNSGPRQSDLSISTFFLYHC